MRASPRDIRRFTIPLFYSPTEARKGTTILRFFFSPISDIIYCPANNTAEAEELASVEYFIVRFYDTCHPSTLLASLFRYRVGPVLFFNSVHICFIIPDF